MSYRYDMRDKSQQVQALVRQRDRAEQIRKDEEAKERQKKETENNG